MSRLLSYWGIFMILFLLGYFICSYIPKSITASSIANISTTQIEYTSLFNDRYYINVPTNDDGSFDDERQVPNNFRPSFVQVFESLYQKHLLISLLMILFSAGLSFTLLRPSTKTSNL